jgi:hypothetical protein
MGAFDGLRSIRLHAEKSGIGDRAQIVNILRAVSADLASLDFESALELDTIVSSNAELSSPNLFYRCCLKDLILAQRMGWARVITLGRGRLLRQLERDEQQCFRAALLSEDPPSPDVVEWWDALSGHMRRENDRKRMDRAREAEWFTLQREIQRLADQGILLQPRWVAIDDNTAGYDILSYDQAHPSPRNRLIEVKSTIASPLRFYITRNEWEQALKYGDAYHFHIWDLAANPPRLFERTVAEVLPHIPEDQAKGKWSTAEVPVGAG